MSKKNFLQGAAILTVAGLLVKVLGAFYRIPLGNMIGDEGMGYYQTSYVFYNLMFAISTSGLPVAIAKLVSEKRALNDFRGAQKVFRVTFFTMLVLGLLTSLTILFGAKYIVYSIVKIPNAYYAVLALAPALLFSPLMSAYRGYFQGMQNMTPTATSQVVEQLFRVLAGLILASVLINKGLSYAAGGASFGASIGSFVGFSTMLVIYFSKRKDIKNEIRNSKKFKSEGTFSILNKILKIAVPITIGASIVPLIGFIDVTIVMDRLKYLGFSNAEASGLYGQLTGFAQTLINFPQIFSIALSVSLVPAISHAMAKRDINTVNRTISTGIRATLMIGLPAAIGLSILSTPIMKLLYYNTEVSVQESSGNILRVLAFSIIFLTLVQTLTAILQGMSKQNIPVINLVIGAVIKIIITYVLTGIPGIGIMGAVIGTIITYMIAALLNYIAIKRNIKIRLSFLNTVLKPIISVTVMGIAVWITYNYLNNIISDKIATILSIGIGAITYGIALLFTGTITSSDFEVLPNGYKISKILKKVGLLRS